MFKIGFDTSALDPGFKAHAQRGIGRYVKELKSFFENSKAVGIDVQFFDYTFINSPKFAEKIFELVPVGRQTLKQQIYYPLLYRRGRLADFNFLHFPAHMDVPSWSMKNYVLTVLDLIPLVCRDMYEADRPGFKFRFARWLEIQAIKNAALIIAISENTAKDVNKLLGIPMDRIIVTPLGVGSEFFKETSPAAMEQVRTKFDIPLDRKIVLYVGGIDQRKNISGLIKSFKALVEMSATKGQQIPVLALAGNIQKDRQYPRLLSLIAEHGLQDLVKLLGYVPDKDLSALYATSSVFFFPSLYEGFGLPPLEAMASGTPVVSSNTSSMPEVLSGAASLVDPGDHVQAAREISYLLNNSEHAKTMSNLGKNRAAKYTWSKTGEKTLEAYKRAASL